MASHVSYGQFGPASYQRDIRSWVFPRDGDRVGTIPIQGDAVEVLKASIDPEATDLSANPTTTVTRFPELQPASSAVLRELATESVTLQRSAAAYNDCNENLAFGQIAHAKSELAIQGSGHAVPVVALPVGRSGEVLRVIRVELRQRNFINRPGVHVELPSLTDEVGYWTGGTEPILQLVFAEGTLHRGSLLAARLRSRTLLFRPLWHQNRKPPVGSYAGCPYPPSRIEVCPLLAITVAQTGGAPHADVAFDPQDQRRIAIVDSVGRWRVFQIAGRHSKSHVMYHLLTIATGDVIPPQMYTERGDAHDLSEVGREVTDDLSQEAQAVPRPRWLRCLFLGHVLLIASRSSLHAVDLNQKGRSTALPVSDLHQGWAEILDVAQIRRVHNEVGVLTSRRVLHLRLDQGNGTWEPSIVASWPHYRTQDERALKLCCNWSSESQFQSFVYSSHATTCSVFCARVDRNNRQVKLFEPTRIRIPLNSTMMAVQQYPIKASETISQGRSLTTLMLLSEDLSLASQYHIFVDEVWDAAGPVTGLVKPKGKALRSFLSDALIHRDDFISFDGPDFPGEPHRTDTAPAPPRWKSVRRPRTAVPSAVGSAYTVDHQRAHSQLLMRFGKTNSVAVTSRSGQEEQWGRLLEILRAISDEEATISGTLLDLGDKPFIVEDIERLSDELRDLAEVTTDVLLTPLPAPPVHGDDLSFRLENMKDFSATAVYDGVINKWISNLPTETPIQTRIALSHLASQIAGDIVLSSVLVRQVGDAPAQAEAAASSNKGKERESQNEGQGQQSNFNEALTGLSDLDASSFVEARADLPPTPEDTSSVVSGSSYSSRRSTTDEAAFERLRGLTGFTDEPDQLQPRIRRILDHWNLGDNPEDYDWTQTRRMLETKGERALNKKAERRARRHLEKQRREAERSSREAMRRPSHSQPAPRTLPIRSSPTRPVTEQSTQPAFGLGPHLPQDQATPMLVASQVSRGRHGARPRPPAQKKRRHGF